MAILLIGYYLSINKQYIDIEGNCRITNRLSRRLQA